MDIYALIEPQPSSLQANLSPSILTKPTTYTQASRDPDWGSAISEEFDALLRNNTWSLVARTPNMNLTSCKWIYRIKQKADGSLERYKVRLVAKGFHQQHGVDYDETFNPVIKPITIRTVLSFAISNGWFGCQLDIKMPSFMASLMKKYI
ncbi:uncharacterized mitochondrial protein AtMg00820-like [Telopea speciosissima]|uniref:uncharacterized mitochondrial protein AtMg00820-like n=1 Tax=Telopea speciosissima TaxID=54955 RepID=UPI001CC47B05|nr:uncharacterized mitochondrial protein AtMg00820-like [Telopea speciosissima]